MRSYFITLIVPFILLSCLDSEEEVFEVFPMSSFDSPFPDRTKNLTWTLGSEFTLKQENDTLNYIVLFEKKSRQNFIINEKTNDTIFAGTVCKYKGLFYFNSQLNDSTYWIHAVKIENGTIRGLQTEREQMFAWDSEFEDSVLDSNDINSKKSPVLKYIDRQNNIIRLTPNKKEMQKFYESIISDFPADTFINWIVPISDSTIDQNISKSELNGMENSELELISKIYPNPAVDFVTIKLSRTGVFEFGIFDENGKLLQQGKLLTEITEIKLSELENGTYFIRVYPADHEEVETVKLIIAR